MVSPVALSAANQRELHRLLLSIRANPQRLDLFLAICDDPDLRDTLIYQYETTLKADGVTTYRTRLDPKDPSLKAVLAELVKYNPALQAGQKAVVTVLGGAQLFGVSPVAGEKSEQEKFFFSLQWTRESLREYCFPVVIWLSEPVATGVARQAEDFWSWRSGVFEFEAQPQAVEPFRADISKAGQPVMVEAPDAALRQVIDQSIADLKQQIAELQQQNPKSPLLTTLYRDLGDAYKKQKEHELAINAYQTALNQASTDKSQQAEIDLKLGETLQDCRRYDQAKHFFEQALAIFQELDDRYMQARTCYRLGDVAYDYRQYKESRLYFQSSIDIYTEIGARRNQASAYHMLGMVAQELREFEQARSHFQQALDIKIEFNDRYSQASTYGQLGNLCQDLREYEQARQHFENALAIHIEFDDRYSQAIDHHNLGMVAQELREYEQARSHYQQALDICIELNDHYSRAKTYHQLGMVAQELREYEQARSHYQQALDIYIDFNDRYRQASTYHHLGMVAQELREYEQARSHYQQALDIYIDFNDRYNQASTYFQLAKAFEATDNLSEAMTCYLQDLQITADFNDEYGLGISIRNLARFYREHPDKKFLAQIAQCLNTTIEDIQQQSADLNRDE